MTEKPHHDANRAHAGHLTTNVQEFRAMVAEQRADMIVVSELCQQAFDKYVNAE